MKILHTITGLSTGGAENLVLEIAQRQADIGHQVKICAIFHEKGVEKFYTAGNVEIIQLGFKSKFHVNILFKLIRICIKYQPDIIHTHLIHATLWGRVAALLLNIPVVTTEHNTSNWQKKYFLIHFLYYITAIWTNKIFAISNAVKSELVKKGKINPQKIEVIYNGIDFKRIQQNGIRSIQHNFSKPIIGSVGRLDVRKGYRYLIEAFPSILRQFPKATLLLVGAGAERNNLERYAQDLKLPVNQIVFCGETDNVVPYLQMMDIFVLPSLHEGFGIAILEAMAAGIPVIGTKAGGIPELIQYHTTGLLVEPANALAIADAVCDLLNHPEKARKLTAHAKKMVSIDFDIDKLTQKLLHCYSDILKIGK